jgi:hypothetical protein
MEMEEILEAAVSPQTVWEAWSKAHALHGGQKGNSQNGFRYQVLDVREGESFSILWKTFFVRMIFTQRVKPSRRGSEISYHVRIKGPFAWPVRWVLGNKIKKNIRLVLNAIVKQLENESRS